MNRRAVGAALCAAAAIVLVLAMVLPWWRVRDHLQETGSRANITLIGGEHCVDDGARSCSSIDLAGQPGLRDDLFAWGGRVTLALLIAAVAAGVSLAFAGGRPRPVLRPAVGGLAMVVAASGAATVSVARLPPLMGVPSLGLGLWVALVGAATLGAGAALPLGSGDPARPGRRFGLAAAVVVLVVLAWASLAGRDWWHLSVPFGHRARSPLGYEVCDVDLCARFGNVIGASSTLLLLGWICAIAGALVVACSGLVTRIVRGIAPGGWAIATVIAASAALISTAIALPVVPTSDAHIGPGLVLFVVAMAGLLASALVARHWFHQVDGVELTPVGRLAGAAGPRPVLAPLGAGAVAPPPKAAPPPPAPPAIAAYAPALATPLRPPTAPVAALGARPSPLCPSCRAPTLWHGKRAAWWCSACKRTL